MASSIPLPALSKPVKGPAPIHGRLQEKRRRWIRCVLDKMLGGRTPFCEVGTLPASGIHRILVIRPNHRLGNTLLVTPLLAELERLYPGAEIDFLGAGTAAQSILSPYPTVREVTCLHHRMARHLLSTVAVLRDIRGARYDLAIDAGGGSQSGRLLLHWVQARHKVGTDIGHDDLLRPTHLAWRPVHMLRRACSWHVEGAFPLMDIRLSEDERQKGKALLGKIVGPTADRSDSVVIAVFANATGSKCYDPSWWQQLVKTMASHHPRLTFVEIVPAHASSRLDAGCPTFYSRDLRKMAAVIAAADAFVSADCGVMHLAAASGARTLGLFSVTDQRKYAPYGNGSAAIDTKHGDPMLAARAIVAHLHDLMPWTSPPGSAGQRESA